MAYTTAHRDELREAIALGATQVRYDGKLVEYRSLADMRSLLREMENELASEDGRRPIRFLRMNSRKGL